MPTLRSFTRLTARIVVSTFVATIVCSVVAPAATPVQASGTGDIDLYATLNGSSYFQAPDAAAFDLTGNMTAEMWIRPSNVSCMTSTTYCQLINKENSYEFGISGGKLEYALTNSSGTWNWYSTDAFLRAGVWHHIAFVVSRSTNTITVYYNGEKSGDTTSAAAVPTTGSNSSGAFSIGNRQAFNEFYTGDIDEVRLYSGVRSQENIRQDMYTYGTINAANLVAYYDFNENSATLVNDAPSAATGTNLTRYGTVTYTDVKTVSNPTSQPGRTVVSFPRSYITSNGGWTVPAGVTRVDALVVAGGGGGGGGADSSGWSGGGGGGGGLRTLSMSPVTPGNALTVAVGGGGLRGQNNVNTAEGLPTNGSASIFGSTSTVGGGYGGMNWTAAGSGGSGGGAGTYNGTSTAGTGTAGEGTNGGAGRADCCTAGGGGGAGGAGGAGTGTYGTAVGGTAGPGVSSSISGSAVFYAAGGAGNSYTTFGSAGTSGGTAVGTDGINGTGAGGGGGGGHAAGGTWRTAGFGGTGTVIVSYGSPISVSTTDNSRLFTGASTSNVAVNDNNLLDLGLDFTAEAWIYPTATACDAHKTFIGKELSFLFAMCNNAISYALMGTSQVWNWTTTSLSVSLNTWQHFAFVRSGGRLTIYKNGGAAAGGTEVTTTSLVPTTVLNNSTNALMLGVREGSSVQSFTGYMDDFRLWSYARSASAIAQNYDKHVAADLIYFPFDESGGPVVYNHAPAVMSTLNGLATSTATIQAAWPASSSTYSASNVYGVLPGYDYQTGGAVTFAITQNGTKGTATVSASTGAFSYVANGGVTGSDSFTYSVTGVNGSVTRTYTINAPSQPMASAKSFRQTADVVATLNTATSLGYNNPATAYTLGETVRATLSATNGVINLTQGSTTIAAGAQNSSTITIDGTQSAINTALNSATVTATSPIPTRVTLDIGMKPGDQVIGGNTYTWNSNGHYYRAMNPGTTTYANAQSGAQSMSLGGRPGYLATIQHSGENATIDAINSRDSYLGGSDRDLQGTYRWKGNDTNSIFRQGGSSFRNRYNNFASGEPNGENGSEDWVEQRSDGLWNDCQDACNRTSYIAEFDPISTRTITELDFQRNLTATAQSARSLGLGTSFINTATWANGEIVRVTLTASAGTVTYTAGSTTLVSGSSGSSTVTFEGSVANINTALNTATVTPSSSGNSTVSLTYGVKRATTGSYIYNATTDHFYLADTTGRLYASAKSTAEGRRWAGTAGYLVTVTSEAEHNTVRNLTTTWTWSGGTDEVSEGQWTWDSPDAYQIYSDFENGLAGAVSYFDPTGEPNGTNYMTVNYGDSKAHWDDSGDANYASITEFSPIDTTLTFNVTATSALSMTAPSSGLAATNGTAYSLTLAATGGQTPYTYALASGSLPTGLTLNSSTGVISGTTSGPGTSNSITIRATDANDATATTASFAITSTPAVCTTSATVVGKWTVEQVTSSGSCLWAVPSGVTSIDAFVVGAGGGGGADGGGGGGGGASQPISGLAVTSGENLTATIGVGGLGAVYGGRASTSGTSTSVARGSTTLITANGGSPGSTGPGAAVGAGGISTLGFAGGAGGAGSAAVGAGSAGKAGASNFFFGTETQYGGGGGGGSYNNGANTYAIPSGASGGGNGCGSPTTSTNTVGVSGVRGGGGGAGCAGNGGRTDAGSGGDGVVLIRYATDPLDAFPASIGTPAYRYVAENYQTLDSTRKQWIDASGNGRHSVSVSGSPTVITTTGNGTAGTIRSLSGGITDAVRFSSFTPSTTNRYTLFQVTRFSGSTRKRILDGVNSNWLSGYWSGSLGVAWHGAWLTASTNNGTNMLNWNLMTDQNQLFRHNGANKVTTSTTQNFESQLAINAGYYGIGGGGLSSFDERSDFNAAEIILYNGELTATQIRQVENYLARTYDLRGFDFTNTPLGANGPGTLTASKVGNVSTGNTTQLSLAWTAPQDTTGVTGYKVEYKKSSDSAWTTFAASASGTTSTITGLEAATAYNTRVTPVDSGAPNRPSITADATTWGTSSITLGSLPASPVTNSNYTLTATVSGPSSTTGTVRFMENGNTIGACGTTSVIGGQASCTWTPSTFGSRSITATFTGDTSFKESTTVSASSVSVDYGACTTSSGTTGRFTFLRVTQVGGCKISTLPAGVESVDVFVVGGGGGGAENVGSGGSGGGAYYAERVSASSASELTVIVGAGGRGGSFATDDITTTTARDGSNGEASSVAWSANAFTGNGGTGGQTYWTNNACTGSGGKNTTVISGGTGSGSGGTASTGGTGGQSSAGSGSNAAAGGAGFSNSITGTTTSYGGGGGGGAWNATAGTGGTGGGGSGGTAAGSNGTANTGGGGGGGGFGCGAGGAGGSGIVIIRYANVPTITTQPAAVTKSTGQSHTFSVTPSATGAVSGDYTYQWRKDGVNIAGATSSTYTVNSLTSTSAGDYSVVVKSVGSSGAVSTVTSSAATLTMTKANQSITFGSLADRVYGVADFTISSTNSVSLQNTFVSNSTSVCTVASPTFSSGTTSATVSVINTGTCSVTASQVGDIDYNAATSVTQTFVVATKTLTITGMTAANKEYDAATAATPSFTNASLVGVVGSDSVTINSAGATATFANKNVGTGKTVTASGVLLAGTHASRYSLTQPTALANITAKELTVTNITANNKVYDGNTSATALLNKGSAALSGVVSGDDVTLSTASATATFANKNVANNKVVTVAGLTISGGDAGNYTLTQPTTNANITLKELTVTGITANNRIYDATTSATNQLVTGSAALAGVQSGDDVTLSTASATATFADKNVGTSKTVTVAGLTISGAAIANYTLTQPTTTASILAKELTVTGISANNRTYDATTSATALLNKGSAALSGVMGGDDVTLSTTAATATFATKVAANNKTVFVANLTISGGDTANYTLTQPTTSANITAKTLTVTGITANNKVYDGNDSATTLLNKGSAALSGVVSGDAVTLSTASATATFADKNVGTGKTVTVAGLTISGNDATNYTLTQPTTSANITAKTLSVTGITANNREYDATVSATALLNKSSAALSGVISGDNVSLSTSSATATFANKNVGTNKVVTVAGLSISGGDAGNYSLTQPTTNATITTKELTVSGIIASNRGYDGTTTAVINTSSATFSGVISGDDVVMVTSSASGTFANANIGLGKTVQIAGITASGTDASNYSITQPTASADIAAKTLTVTGITATSRVYNGSTSATAQLVTTNAALAGIENNDAITLVTSGIAGVYDNKNVGTNKTITVSGLSITGTNASNYTLVQPTVTTGRITTKLLSVTGITANNKVYDGNTAATSLLNKGGAALSGLVSGDNVALSTTNATATFADRFVSGNKTVTIAGITVSGTDASNYQLVQPQTQATITPKELTVTGIVGVNRVYNASTTADGDLDASAATLVGVVGSDDVVLDTQSMTGTFNNKNVGTNKTITVADLSVYGNDIGNYTLTQPTTTASITAKTLTVTGITANNKMYDGNNSATTLLNKGSAALSGVVSGDAVTLSTASATATFADKNVGNSRTITVAGLTISGDDATNYTLTQPTTSANITAKTLTVSGVTANNKTYDQNTTASLNLGSAAFVGIISGDTVTISTTSATGTFSSKTVGSNKTVSVAGITKLGTDAANYTIQQPTTNASILAKELTVTGITATTKIYDSTTTAALTTSSAVLSGVISGDAVTLDTSSATGAFATNTVESGKVVSVTGLTISGGDAANYTLTQPTTTADILSASAGLTWSVPSNIVYGTVLSSSQLNATASVAGQFTYTPPSGTQLAAGTHTLSVTFVPANVSYDSDTTTVTITVTAKALTVTGITANNRTYDATNAATDQLVIGSAALSGVVSGDNVTLSTASATATFADKNVGVGKLVTIAGLTISGGSATNYTLTQPTTNASILAKEITVTGITANNREYNATDSATALLNKNSAALSGVISGDNVSLSTASATATFANKNVGTNKTVLVAGLAISGDDATNYTLTQPTTNANITAKELTVTGITANNREYNATDSATALLNKNSAALFGVISGDNVSLSTASATATFANKNVGTNKTITVAGLIISGGDATNYTLTQPTTSANITAKELTVTGITANNREYNATDSATALLNKNSAALSGVVSGDNVSLSTASATATFANKNVGTNKTITVAGLIISGGDATNYTLTQPTTNASITAKELTVTGITTTSRPFNNTASATALVSTSGASLSGVISGDNVTVSYASLAAVFADANVGASKPVTISGITIAGGDAANYSLTQPTATATVTQAAPVLTWAQPSDITFGTSLSSAQLNASATFAQTTLAGTFSYSPASGSRLDAGTHTLSVTFTPTSGNYATDTTTVSLTVTQKAVTVTADNESIVYGSLPQSTFSITGLATGDSEGSTTFTYAGTGGTSYSSSTTAPASAGSYSITPSALSLSVGRLANYAITYQPGALTIAKAVQQPVTAVSSSTTVTFAPAPNKTTVSLSSTGGSGDGAVTYAVAVNDPCSVNGTTLTVDGAGSCSVTATKATSANFLSRSSSPVVITVNKAAQTLSLDAISGKTYGDSSFTVTTSATSGLTVSIAASPSTVCDVPSGQTIRIISTGTCTVTATQSGDSNWLAANVASGSSSTRSFVVSPKALTVLGATANNKTYDGTPNATAQISFASASLSGVVSGDSVSINSSNVTASFANKNIGTSKPITVAGVELAGTHAHRYVVDVPTNLSANITALSITVSGISVPTRAYNGTDVASLSTSTYAFAGVVNNDSVTLNDSSYIATFADANVSPTAKLVTVSGLQLSGTDALNYTLTQPTLQGFIVKATASILFGPSVSAVYSGSPLPIATATQPSSLSLVVSYSGSGQTSYGPSATAPTNAGSYGVSATVNDVNYQGNGSSPWTITKQTISVQISQASLSQTFIGSVRPVVASTTPSGKNVSISYNGTNGTVYQSSWAPVNAGTYSVSVTVAEANFQGTVTETLTVQKANQSPILLTNTSSLRFGTTVQLVPVGGSGSGAYTYSVASGPCQVNDQTGVVTPSGVGNCSVVAHRDASMNYHSASSSPFVLSVSKGTHVAAFTSLIPSVPVTGSTYTPTATTTSGLAPTISVTTGAGSVCTLSSGAVTFNASGLCVISASHSGDSNWLAATTSTQSIEVGKLSQAITFPQPSPVDLGSPDFTLEASSSSGLPLTYSVTAGNSVCSVSSIGIVTVVGVGTCTIETQQAGNSTFAAASTVARSLTVLPSLPAAPHITSISSGDSTVTVGFKAPHSNGGSPIVSYALVATSNTAPTVTRSDCSASALSCSLIGLVNGTSYSISVAAINIRGTGVASDTEEVLIPLPTVAAARNIVGTRQSTTLDLTWEDPNTYGPGIFVHYEVYLKQRGGSFGAPVTVQSSDRIVRALTTQSRTVQFTQLDPSRMYESKIVTITSTASTESAENTASALVMPLSSPSAPRDLSVEAPTGTSARLSWRTPETDGGSALLNYSVTTNAGTCSLSSPLATSCTITGLQPGSSLSVSLRAVNGSGQSIPASTSITLPTVPGAPTLGVISTGTTSASVSWSAPASNGGRSITSYSVEASEVNQPSQVLRCTTAGLSCVINNMKTTTQYSFTVRAINSVGNGAVSAAVSLATGRTASNEWDSYRTTTPTMVASQLSLPPAPARVTSQSVGGRRTQITAVRSARDASIPVTYALISVTTRTNKLLARIKVIVDPQNPTTTVSVPYASSKIKIAVQFANEIGLSPGGPSGTNIAEGNTFEWTTVAGQVSLVGSQVPGGIYFARGSAQLSYATQQTLKKMAVTAKNRGGLVYVTGFAQRGESKSAWRLEPLARARAEAVAKYLSRLGVRQWITFHGTTARATTGWTPISDRRVVVTTVYPNDSSPSV